MKPLEPPDSHHFSAAIGWLELGNPAEARQELDRIAPALQAHPDILEARWSICAEEQNWEAALTVARALLQNDPLRVTGWLHQAYALRRAPGGSVEAAWQALLPAGDKFPGEPTVPYNLACYACQMNRLDAARDWFQRALKIGGIAKIKIMALRDPDLEPLWEEISKF